MSNKLHKYQLKCFDKLIYKNIELNLNLDINILE